MFMTVFTTPATGTCKEPAEQVPLNAMVSHIKEPHESNEGCTVTRNGFRKL
jgi:hypothetical protein